MIEGNPAALVLMHAYSPPALRVNVQRLSDDGEEIGHPFICDAAITDFHHPRCIRTMSARLLPDGSYKTLGGGAVAISPVTAEPAGRLHAEWNVMRNRLESLDLIGERDGRLYWRESGDWIA